MFFLTGSWFYKCLIADLRNKGLVQTTKQVICQFGKEQSLLIPAQDPAPFGTLLECLHRARGHNTGLWEDPHLLKQQVEASEPNLEFLKTLDPILR